MSKPAQQLKTLLVGRPKQTAGLEHERLTKKVALAVFASDNLSSSAYATEEMLHVLIVGGTAALFYSIPITIAITAVLGIIAFSYRETIHAYPSGGGAYIVAHENLGRYPGLTAASALLIDYILTVSVSISAGVAALISAAPKLEPFHVPIALGVIALITILNLRGVKEAGTIFAVPTYAFVFLLGATIIWGFARYFLFGYRPPAPPNIPATQAITIFLLARAFSHGSTAVTGIEAISNGVQAFEKPEAKNAAVTLAAMAGILAFLFVGITLLAQIYHITGPSEAPKRTVVALIALTVFGQGPMFYAVQAATALILFLAANTSYADFPRLAAALGKDRYAPRQLMNRGDRLAFSNGIVGLALLASVLVVIFDADVSRLINLYVVGVFTSLTLSQLGMVRHWRENSKVERKWRSYLLINAIGAFATFVVLIIVLATKFMDGAWMVVAAAPIVILFLDRTNRHYREVGLYLRDPANMPPRPKSHSVVVLVGWPSEEERRALAYARLIKGADLRCVHFSLPDERSGLVAEWSRVLDNAPSLEIVPRRSSLAKEVRRYVHDLKARNGQDSIVTVVVPERVKLGFGKLLANRQVLLLKAYLLFTPGVVVTDVAYHVDQPESALDPAIESRHIALVLVSGVHNATFRAINYARTMSADQMHVVHVSIDPEESNKIVFNWEVQSPGEPLLVIESPYRELNRPLMDYVRHLVANGRTTVTLILPEFVVGKRWHNLLHNQNALQIKRRFLFEPNVIVTSVPTSLGDSVKPRLARRAQ